jgi:diacylglycerol kinase family enzyme
LHRCRSSRSRTALTRVALIVNPLATGVDESRLALVQRALGRIGTVETVLTERRGHATEVARSFANDADAIFVFSGDGGFNEVANGLHADGPPLAPIPGGGTSVFPRALGLPRDPLAAVERLVDAFAQGRTRRISVGRVNGRRFLFSAGLVLDAELVRRIEAHRSRAGRPGDVAFVLTLLKVVAEQRGRFEPVVDVEGLGRVAFMLVANTDPYTYLGRFPVHVAPGTAFAHGLAALAPARTTPLSVVRLLAYVLTGRGAAPTVTGADVLRARSDRPVPLQADGEDLGDVTEAVFEAERDAIRVVAG